MVKSKVNLINPEFKHIFSFSREATVELSVSKDSFPKKVNVNYDGKTYMLSIGTAVTSVTKCNKANHYASKCTNSAPSGTVSYTSVVRGGTQGRNSPATNVGPTIIPVGTPCTSTMPVNSVPSGTGRERELRF